MKYKYKVIVEKFEGNYCAYSPEIPGCCTIGDTVEEALQRMPEALSLHLEGLKAKGLPIPEPNMRFYIEVNV